MQSTTASCFQDEIQFRCQVLSSLELRRLDAGWEKCESWTLADCRLHQAAYPSRSAPPVLLPPDRFPHWLSNVSAGCGVTGPCIKSAWSRRCLWSSLSAFKAAHQLLLLCPTFLFFFSTDWEGASFVISSLQFSKGCSWIQVVCCWAVVWTSLALFFA